MKKILFTLMIMLLPIMAMANVNLGIKKADEFIVIPLLTLDSAGVDRAPDSIQILTWLDGGTALQFSASNTTYPFSAISIDTSKIFADTTYWFVEQIQDIDGTPTPQNYSLAIDVITWTKVIATHNRATVQVISDSLEVMVDDITKIADTVQGIIDSLQNQDDWVATSANQTTMRDTLSAIIDTLEGTAMDNLKEAFDGDNTGSRMVLTNLHIKTTAASDTALVIEATGTGNSYGLYLRSANAQGAIILSSGSSGFQGLLVQGPIGAEFRGTSSIGFKVVGDGTSPGILAIGGTDGPGGDGMSLSGGGSQGVGLGLASASSSLIEDDAITAATIAADAVDEISEKVWYSIDTLNVDSSKIGEWLVNNLSGAAGGLDTLNTAFVNRLTGRIADTNWLSLLEARDGVPGSFGDSAQGWGATANLTNVTDTVNAIIDTLQRFTKPATDTLQGIIDTLQNQDNWVLAKSDSASYMNLKSIGGQANTTSPANLNEAFDGDATASGRILLVESLNDLADSSIDAAAIKSYSFSTTKFAGSFLTADLLDGTAREEIWNIPFSDAATVAGSMWDSLNNSSYVQGSSGLDSSTLAGWVWNTPQSNHTTAGTFGKYLDTEISSIGSGSGAFSYQLVTYDSTTSQVIPGTNLAVRNIDQSALIAVGKSDLLGSETFNLDADSFIIVATSPGYIYQTFDTLIVTGAGIDTVFGDQFDPGSPVFPALCRVYGYLYSVSAVPEKDAVVRAYLPAGAAQSGNLIISPFMVTTTSDSSGYFFLDLIRSDSLVPAATQYDLIIERSDGTIVHKRITVPDSTSWQLDW